ncbi:class I adenylate cyclase [Escherichia coli]
MYRYRNWKTPSRLYGAIWRNKLHGLSVQLKPITFDLPAVVDGFASEGIIQFFFEETQNENGFNIYILNRKQPG